MMHMKFRTGLGLAALLTLLTTAAQAEITLKAEQSDGDKIADIAKITAKAESGDGIDKVEFRVDDELRFTDASTPYVYEWDTIKDKEGMHAVSITAYDSTGATKRVTLNVTVDNELGQGSDALAQKAQEALHEKNTAEAVRYSRRALKAEEGNLLASRTLAGVHARTRDWKKAITSLEAAKGLNTNAVAMNELASYRIQQALLPDNAANFYTELVAADDLRRKAADLAVLEIMKQSGNTAAQHEAVGDALITAGKFRQAVSEYGKSGLGADAPLSSVNRLGLAYTLDERPTEALALLRPMVRAKKDDAVTRAVLGLALLRSREFAEARATVQPDLAAQVPGAMIIAAYADAALGKKREASAVAKDVASLLPSSGDAQYALALAATDPRDSEQAIQKTLALAPFQSGPVLDYASRLLLTKRQDRIEQALNLTDLIIKHEPDNLNAKLMQALLHLSSKRFTDAEPILTWVQRKDSKAPDVLMGLATYWDLKENGPLVSRLLTAAKQADARFERQSPETPLELLVTLNRKMLYRSGFFLLPSTLYPKQEGVSF